MKTVKLVLVFATTTASPIIISGFTFYRRNIHGYELLSSQLMKTEEGGVGIGINSGSGSVTLDGMSTFQIKSISTNYSRRNSKLIQMRQSLNSKNEEDQGQDQYQNSPRQTSSHTGTGTGTGTGTQLEMISGSTVVEGNETILYAAENSLNGKINGDTVIVSGGAKANGEAVTQQHVNGHIGIEANRQKNIRDDTLQAKEDTDVESDSDGNVVNGEGTNDMEANDDITNGEEEVDTEANSDSINGTEGELTVEQAEILATPMDGDQMKSYEIISNASSSLLKEQVKDLAQPIFGREFEKGVPKDTIKGALLAGATLTMIMSNFNLSAAAAVALWTAYVSITPGKPGKLARVFGDAAWDTTNTIKKIALAIGIRLPFIKAETPSYGQEILKVKEEIQLDDDIVNLVQEVDDTVAEVNDVLSAPSTVTADEQLVDDAERLAQEARELEIEYLLEEARIEKEAFRAEEEYHAVEAQIAEEERLEEQIMIKEEEEKEARLEEEQRQIAEASRIAEEQLAEDAMLAKKQEIEEEARVAEKQKIEEEARVDEEQKIEEEARLAEERRIEEEARLTTGSQSDDKIVGDDDDDDDFIDDVEWEASIQLADDIEYNDDQDEGYKNDWNAARQLANALNDDSDADSFDYDAPGLTEEERMELIAQAARAAVEKFEVEKQEEETLAGKEKDKRNSMKLELQNADILKVSEDTRQVSSMMDEGKTNEIVEDYEKLTVKKLKEVLRSRGLKVSGKKAELIERLRSQ